MQLLPNLSNLLFIICFLLHQSMSVDDCGCGPDPTWEYRLDDMCYRLITWKDSGETKDHFQLHDGYTFDKAEEKCQEMDAHLPILKEEKNFLAFGVVVDKVAYHLQFFWPIGLKMVGSDLTWVDGTKFDPVSNYSEKTKKSVQKVLGASLFVCAEGKRNYVYSHTDIKLQSCDHIQAREEEQFCQKPCVNTSTTVTVVTIPPTTIEPVTITNTPKPADSCPMEYKTRSCMEFEHEIQDHAQTKRTSLISDKRYSHLNALDSQTCYVLVKDSRHHTRASEICSNSGGRLAWVLNNATAANLIDHAILEGVMLSLTSDPKTEDYAKSVWIGQTSTTNGTLAVWDCPTNQTLKMKAQDACYNMGYEFKANTKGAAALCNLDEDTISNPASCFCWFTEQSNIALPFYCEMRAPCSVENTQTCGEFEQHIKDQGLVPVAHVPQTLVPDACFVFVNKRASWNLADEICTLAGGRLAWTPDENLADHLKSFASNFSTPADNVWIGLQKWEFNQSLRDVPFSVWQWYCPGKGQNLKWVDVNTEYRGALETWARGQPDPTDVVPGRLCITGGQNGFCASRADSLLKIPFFCEINSVAIMSEPWVPLVPPPPRRPTTTRAATDSPSGIKKTSAAVTEATIQKAISADATLEMEFDRHLGLYVSGSLTIFFILFLFVIFLAARHEFGAREEAEKESSTVDEASTDAGPERSRTASASVSATETEDSDKAGVSKSASSPSASTKSTEAESTNKRVSEQREGE